MRPPKQTRPLLIWMTGCFKNNKKKKRSICRGGILYAPKNIWHKVINRQTKTFFPLMQLLRILDFDRNQLDI